MTASQTAVATDTADAASCQAAYFPEHNADMLVYAANMGGQVWPALHLAFVLSKRLRCWEC